MASSLSAGATSLSNNDNQFSLKKASRPRLRPLSAEFAPSLRTSITSKSLLPASSAVPMNLEIALAFEAQNATVAVTTETPATETSALAHSDVDNTLFAGMPMASIASGLSDIIMPSTPAVVADSDGFFRSLGDDAQMALSINNQPITDELVTLFSTQIPLNTIQSVEAGDGVLRLNTATKRLWWSQQSRAPASDTRPMVISSGYAVPDRIGAPNRCRFPRVRR